MKERTVYGEQIREAAATVDAAFDGRTVLITGATGMIGVCLIDTLLQSGRPARIIAAGRDRERAKARLSGRFGDTEFLEHDVNEAFPEVECDLIVCGASHTHPVQYAGDPIGTITANAIGTKNVLDLAVKQKACRVIFLSSVEIYGENRGDAEKFDERYCGYIDCNTLRAGYPESKRAGEALCQAYIAAKDLDVVIARLARVYGPTAREDDSKAVAQFVKKAAAGEDVILKSAGDQLYSYAHVVDAATAILHILANGARGEAYNVASRDSDISLRELAHLAAEAAGTKVVSGTPAREEAKGYSPATKALLDTGKLNALGWESRHSLKEGIRQTVEILRDKATWNRP
jgi:nucleoside-diphosphate-sugar epimerase